MSMISNSQVEIYPMPSFPTLVVSDIDASSRWYCEALGFTRVFTMPGPAGIPTLAHLRWIKYADLLLFPDHDQSLAHLPRGVGVALNYSLEDVDQLADRAHRHNVLIVDGPAVENPRIGHLGS